MTQLWPGCNCGEGNARLHLSNCALFNAPKPTGTCPTCGREGLRLTKTGRVWNHRDPHSRMASGAFGLNCRGGKPTPTTGDPR